MADNNFGNRLRDLRKKSGESIKSLAKDLDVNYTYLSQMENNKKIPSEELIDKIAKRFNHDSEELKIIAGKIPEDIKKILMDNPKKAVDFLRKKFDERS